MNWKDRSSKGLVLVGVLMILLILAAYSMLRLNSVIIQVGTSGWIQMDGMARAYTLGGANEILATGVKSPDALTNTLFFKNYSLDVHDLGEDYIGKESQWNDNYTSGFIFPRRHVHLDYRFQTTTPIISGGVPGFNEGQYCRYRYIVAAEGTITFVDLNDKRVKRHLAGELLVGPLLCR